MKLRNLISTILLLLAAVGVCSADTNAEVNRRKFGGKELMSDHGYNSYDFAARHQNPAFPHFTTPDPLAEKFKHLSPHLFCAGDPINLIDPTGMVISLNQMTEDERKAWNEFVEMYSSSTLFQTLYSFLEQSETVITVKFDKINTGGKFNPETNTITLPQGESESITFVGAEATEELFHAYQNLNPECYDGVEINKEFEAKTFKTLVAIDSNGVMASQGYRGLSVMDNNILLQKYGCLNSDVLQQIIDDSSTFNVDYYKYANVFSDYCISNNIGNSNYHQTNNSPPRAIQKIIMMVFKNKLK